VHSGSSVKAEFAVFIVRIDKTDNLHSFGIMPYAVRITVVFR